MIIILKVKCKESVSDEERVVMCVFGACLVPVCVCLFVCARNDETESGNWGVGHKVLN